MVKLPKASTLNEKLHHLSDAVGDLLVDAFHYVALFAIGGAIVWSAASLSGSASDSTVAPQPLRSMTSSKYYAPQGTIKL